jgi:hypothetical protein
MKPHILERVWLQALKLPLATWLTLLGLYFFYTQASSYNDFYGPLSVNLEDVGLTYTTILIQSGEQIVVQLFLVVLAFYTLHRGLQITREGRWIIGPMYHGKWSKLRQLGTPLKPSDGSPLPSFSCSRFWCMCLTLALLTDELGPVFCQFVRAEQLTR